MTILKKIADTYNSDGDFSLLDHLEAFRWTLLWCLGAAAFLAIPGIIFIPDLLLKYVRYVCPPGMSLHYFSPFEPLMVQLELGGLAGVIAALPFIFFKIAEFVAPGLYQHERRWSFFFLFSSAVLMTTGAALALAVVVPIVMNFSGTFAADGLQPVIGLGAFLRFSGMLAAGFAVVFELPVALLLAIRCGLISVDTLRRKRPVFIVILFTAAAIMTPPDVVSQLLMGLPGWILFEVTLLIGDRITPKKTEETPSYQVSPLSEEKESEEEDTSRYSVPSKPAASSEGSAAEPYVDDSPYRHAARRKRKIRHL